MRTNTFTGDSPFARFVFRNAEDGAGSGGEDTTQNNENTNDTESNGSGGSDDFDIEAILKNPKIQKLLTEATEKAVSGLKKKNEEVIGDNKKLKSELSAAKSKPTLSDEEFTEFQTIKERLARDEFARLIAEGKSEEVIERVTKRTRLELEAKIAAETEVRQAKEAEASEWRSRYEKTLVDVELAKATAQAIKPQYQELVAELAAKRVKLVDGAVRVVNADGEIEMNTAGTKPLSVQDFIETMRSNYADLFITSSGGGAGGSGKKAPAGSSKLSVEYASTLPFEEYKAAREAGKIA